MWSDSSYFASLKITVKKLKLTFETRMLPPVGEHIILNVFVQSLRHLVQILQVVRLLAPIIRTFTCIF